MRARRAMDDTSGSPDPGCRSSEEPVQSMQDTLFIGIDGGGTNCRARIADAAGSRVGEGLGGPASVRRKLNVVVDSILTASRAAAEAAGLTEADLKRAHAGFGLAGAAVTDRRERLRRRLEGDGH